MVKLAFLGINAEVLFRKLGETDDNEIEGIAKYQKLNTNQIPTENDGKESCNYQSSEVQQPYLDESEIERSEQTIESLRLLKVATINYNRNRLQKFWRQIIFQVILIM